MRRFMLWLTLLGLVTFTIGCGGNGDGGNGDNGGNGEPGDAEPAPAPVDP